MSYDDWKLASPEDEWGEDEEGCNACDGFVWEGEQCDACGLKGTIPASSRCPFKESGKQCEFIARHEPLAHWIREEWEASSRQIADDGSED